MLESVSVPKEFEPLFKKAQDTVKKFFESKSEKPSQGTIEIFDDRYILIRSSSLAVDFFETARTLYQDYGHQEAIDITRSLLFDIAHSIGKMDARKFHQKMNLKDPVDKLSAGPIHFAYTGWAFVKILPESKPSPDENFYIIYDHPYSFESDSWIKQGKESHFPVCVMNAGYSSGWCEESFGVPLVSWEIQCKAQGDDICRFIMAHPSKIEQRVEEYLQKEHEKSDSIKNYRIPSLTKRKEMEHSLRRLAMIAEQTGEGIAVTNQDKIVQFANAAWLQMHGYDQNDNVVGKPLSIFHNETQLKNDVIPFYEATMRTGQGAAELKHIRKDGSEFPTKTTMTIFKDEKNNPVGLIVFATDITEQKQAETQLAVYRDNLEDLVVERTTELVDLNEQLKKEINERRRIEQALIENKERFRIAATSISDLIYEWDIQTNEIHWFGDFEGMLGYESGEVSRTVEGWMSLIHPDDQQKLIDSAKLHKNSTKPIKEEYRIRRKDGSWMYWIDKATAIIDSNKKPVKWIGACTDITERKTIEQQQKELMKQLEDINTELKSFAYIVSHDLKAPLRGIKTLATWITEDYADKLDDEGKEQLKLMGSRVSRMESLINGILQYSRVGRIKEETVRVDLNKLAEEVIDMVSGPENIEISVEGELPVIEFEKTRITQVFQNLLSNAVKYMDKPQGKITISCTEQDDFWQFSVADNGPGIDSKHFDKIFQIFQTLQAKDSYESTGVGLTLVKKIIETNGGKIWVESELGKGSTFFFTIAKNKAALSEKPELQTVTAG